MAKKRKIKKNEKYCPKCGLILKKEDSFCINCGYSFEKRRGKKTKNLYLIIIILIIFLALWILIRTSQNMPILPKFISDLFTGFNQGLINKTA